MKTKLPPAIVLAIATGIHFLGVWQLQTYPSIFGGKTPLPYLVAGVGFILMAASLIAFQRTKTTIDPVNLNKASSLVTTGPFRFSRNPIYLAMTLILMGIIIPQPNILSAVSIVFFVLTINYYQIKPEERVLIEKFGEAYEQYCNRTRRWI